MMKMNGLKRFFKKSSWRCSWKGAAFALLLGMSMEAEAQISFSCFEANSYFSYDINILRQNFTLEGEKEAKYVEVVWYAFNKVGDRIESPIPNPHKVRATGPFKPGKKYKTATSPFRVDQKNYAIPNTVIIVYMDGEELEIDINTENYHKYFPNLKHWFDVDVSESRDD